VVLNMENGVAGTRYNCILKLKWSSRSTLFWKRKDGYPTQKEKWSLKKSKKYLWGDRSIVKVTHPPGFQYRGGTPVPRMPLESGANANQVRENI
jgi:hypothetical protein